MNYTDAFQAKKESALAEKALGKFSAKDADKGDTLTYSILEEQSGLFELKNNLLVLKSGAHLDFETAQKHDIIVKITDTAGHSLQDTFTVYVSDVNEAPTDIALSAATISEVVKKGTVVGTLSGVDPEGDRLTFFTDKSVFTVKGDQLVIKPTTKARRLLFSSETHELSYDLDGKGSKFNAVVIATSQERRSPHAERLRACLIAYDFAIGIDLGTIPVLTATSRLAPHRLTT